MFSVNSFLLLAMFGFCLLTSIQAQCPASAPAESVNTPTTCGSNADACFSYGCVGNTGANGDPFDLPNTMNTAAQCVSFPTGLPSPETWAVGVYSGSFSILSVGGGHCVTSGLSCTSTNTGCTGSGSVTCTPTTTAPPSSMVVTFADSNNFDYTITLQTAPCSGSVTSDPYFVGFWGQNFTVMGTAGNIYNVISDATVQINSLFIYLDDVQCPTVRGLEIPNCINHHAGTYFGKIAISSSNGDQVVVTAGSGKHGFNDVTVNGKQLTIGASYGTEDRLAKHPHRRNVSAVDHSPRTSIYLKRTNYRSLVVHAGVYEILLQNSDNYLDLTTVDVVCWDCLLKQVQPEGLLGRTWNQNYVNVSDAEVMKYQESEANLFGCKFENDKFCSKAK